MSEGKGILTKAGFWKDPQTSSYPYIGWTFPLANSHGVPIMSEGITREKETEEDATLQGRAGLKKSDTVGISVSGPIDLQAKYMSIGRLICMAMGFENPNDPGATYHGSPEAVGTKYKHVIELDEELATQGWLLNEERLPSGSGGGTWTASDQKVRRGLIGIAKQISDWLVYSAMVQKMTIKITANRININFEFIGYNQARVDAQSSNWDLPTYQTNIIWPDLEVKIGSVDGTTYAWAEIGIKEATIELNNNLDVVRDTQSGLYITEPSRQGKR